MCGCVIIINTFCFFFWLLLVILTHTHAHACTSHICRISFVSFIPIFFLISSFFLGVLRSTCVFESSFGFILDCNFRKSSLFRVRNLGGVKAHFGLGKLCSWTKQNKKTNKLISSCVFVEFLSSNAKQNVFTSLIRSSDWEERVMVVILVWRNKNIAFENCIDRRNRTSFVHSIWNINFEMSFAHSIKEIAIGQQYKVKSHLVKGKQSIQ